MGPLLPSLDRESLGKLSLLFKTDTAKQGLPQLVLQPVAWQGGPNIQVG